MFLTDYIIVARQQVKRSEARCLHCGQPFSKENVFTREGMTEIAISGICEKCFDGLFEEGGDYESPVF